MLFIDASRYGNTAQKTGVENYSFHLINAMAKLAPKELTLVTPKKVDLPLPQIVIPFPRLWTQLRLSWEVLLNKKIDHLFVPSHLMPIIHPKDTVITIHDVAFRRFPKSYGFLSRLYLDWGTKFAVKHARAIIVPSETTKQDLVEFYKADPAKITVIPLGFEQTVVKQTPEQAKSILEKYQLYPQRYFLFVGRIESKKNIQTLLSAFEEFKTQKTGFQLVLAGKLGVGGESILKQVKTPDIVVTGYVDEPTKQALLNHALAFVFPSLFEGFGIPLLEAMAAGIPLICSKIPSSWEMAKENALFFDPEDVQALSALLEKVATGESLRKMMVQNHPATLARYSWEKAAENTLKVLSAT